MKRRVITDTLVWDMFKGWVEFPGHTAMIQKFDQNGERVDWWVGTF